MKLRRSGVRVTLIVEYVDTTEKVTYLGHESVYDPLCTAAQASDAMTTGTFVPLISMIVSGLRKGRVSPDSVRSKIQAGPGTIRPKLHVVKDEE